MKKILQIVFLVSVFISEIICKRKEYYYNKIHTVKLEGNSTFTYYYVNTYIGSPPQRQTVIVDTGSNIMTFPCSDCQKGGCGHHIDKPFDLSASHTVDVVKCGDQIENYHCQKCDNQNRCQFSISYSEGSSLKGYYIQDYVVMGDEIQDYLEKGKADSDELLKFINHEKVRMPFGCTTRETNLFVTQNADGIMGLAPNTNSNSTFPNIIDEIFLQHSDNNEELAFAICFSNYDGGIMSIGGYNHNYHIEGENTHIINYKKDSKYYEINMHKISINGEDLEINNFNQPIVDSGTTFVEAPYKIKIKLDSHITKYLDKKQKDFEINNDKIKCVENKPKEQGLTVYQWNKSACTINDFYDHFPTIEFELDNNFIFKWTPENYLVIKSLKNMDQFYLGYGQYGGSHMILGGTWMHSYDILFDRTDNELHFTKSKCSDSDINQHYIHNGDIQTTQQDKTYFGLVHRKVGLSDVLYYIFFFFIGLPILIVGGIQIYKLCRKSIFRSRQELIQDYVTNMVEEQKQNRQIIHNNSDDDEDTIQKVSSPEKIDESINISVEQQNQENQQELEDIQQQQEDN